MTSPAHTAHRPRKRLSILLADDEPDTLRMLALILEDEGHVVQTVNHGALVREAVRRFNPDVCILDIQMPGASGYAVARDLTDSLGEQAPLLIAISGMWTSQTDRQLAKTVGFAHFLRKPADPAELITILDNHTPPSAGSPPHRSNKQRLLLDALRLMGRAELALRLNVPQQTLDAWLNGTQELPERELTALANALDRWARNEAVRTGDSRFKQ